MRLHGIAAILLIISLIIPQGCKDDGVTVQGRPVGLYGLVVDSTGRAIPEVDVHYIFYTLTNPVVLNIGIQYGLLTPEVVTLKVFGPLGQEVATLVDSQQQAVGNYVVSFGLDATNGVYSYALQIGDSLRNGSFFIRDDEPIRLVTKPPLVKTDQSGQFFLSPLTLGIGRTFSNDMILDSLLLVLNKAGYNSLVQSFRLDTTLAIDGSFTLEAN